MIFEAGDLRYIRFGDHEILRRVSMLLSAITIGTRYFRSSQTFRLRRRGDTFRITYDVENKAGDVDFFWRGTIAGDANGTITFSMDGEARSTFRRNRIGFCVLHPMSRSRPPVPY